MATINDVLESVSDAVSQMVEWVLAENDRVRVGQYRQGAIVVVKSVEFLQVLGLKAANLWLKIDKQDMHDRMANAAKNLKKSGEVVLDAATRLEVNKQDLEAKRDMLETAKNIMRDVPVLLQLNDLYEVQNLIRNANRAASNTSKIATTSFDQSFSMTAQEFMADCTETVRLSFKRCPRIADSQLKERLHNAAESLRTESIAVLSQCQVMISNPQVDLPGDGNNDDAAAASPGGKKKGSKKKSAKTKKESNRDPARVKLDALTNNCLDCVAEIIVCARLSSESPFDLSMIDGLSLNDKIRRTLAEKILAMHTDIVSDLNRMNNDARDESLNNLNKDLDETKKRMNQQANFAMALADDPAFGPDFRDELLDAADLLSRLMKDMAGEIEMKDPNETDEAFFAKLANQMKQMTAAENLIFDAANIVCGNEWYEKLESEVSAFDGNVLDNKDANAAAKNIATIDELLKEMQKNLANSAQNKDISDAKRERLQKCGESLDGKAKDLLQRGKAVLESDGQNNDKEREALKREEIELLRLANECLVALNGNPRSEMLTSANAMNENLSAIDKALDSKKIMKKKEGKPSKKETERMKSATKALKEWQIPSTNAEIDSALKNAKANNNDNDNDSDKKDSLSVDEELVLRLKKLRADAEKQLQLAKQIVSDDAHNGGKDDKSKKKSERKQKEKELANIEKCADNLNNAVNSLENNATDYFKAIAESDNGKERDSKKNLKKSIAETKQRNLELLKSCLQSDADRVLKELADELHKNLNALEDAAKNGTDKDVQMAKNNFEETLQKADLVYELIADEFSEIPNRPEHIRNAAKHLQSEANALKPLLTDYRKEPDSISAEVKFSIKAKDVHNAIDNVTKLATGSRELSPEEKEKLRLKREAEERERQRLLELERERERQRLAKIKEEEDRLRREAEERERKLREEEERRRREAEEAERRRKEAERLKKEQEEMERLRKAAEEAERLRREAEERRRREEEEERRRREAERLRREAEERARKEAERLKREEEERRRREEEERKRREEEERLRKEREELQRRLEERRLREQSLPKVQIVEIADAAQTIHDKLDGTMSRNRFDPNSSEGRLFDAARKIAELMDKLARSTDKAEQIQLAREIAQLVKIVIKESETQASNCTDKRLQEDLLHYSTLCGTVSVQLKMICAVKAASNDDTQSTMRAQLVKCARDLCRDVVHTCDASEVAAIRVMKKK